MPSLRLKAILIAILVTVLWSSSWVLIKIGLRHSLPAVTFAGLRYTLAFLCLAPFVLLNSSHRQALKRLSRREWFRLSLLGVVYYTLTQSAIFLALAYLPANMVSLLLNLTSIFVGIAGIFLLKERPSALQWVGIFLAAAGVGIYFFPASLPQAQIIGVGFGLFCMAANVASSLFGREVNREARLSPLLVTFVSMGVGAARRGKGNSMDNAQELSHSAWRQLAHEWSEAQEAWHDSTTEYFEHYFANPLESETGTFQRALESLLATLQAAREAAAS